MTLPTTFPKPFELRLEKWHGAKNDFFFVEMADLPTALGQFSPNNELIGQMAQALTARLSGLGADGLVIWSNDKTTGAVFAGIWNSDGSRASTCGNALRCFGSLLLAHGIWSGQSPLQILTLESVAEQSHAFATLISAIATDAQGAYQATVDMGSVLKVELQSLSMLSDKIPTLQNIGVGVPSLSATFVQLANPHLVLQVTRGLVSQRNFSEIEELGRFFQSSDVCQLLKIPVSNIGFIETEADESDGMHRGVVYERGAGLTQCCGSGGCAMLMSFKHSGRSINSAGLHILMPGGAIRVQHSPEGELLLSGPAQRVAECQLRFWI